MKAVLILLFSAVLTSSVFYNGPIIGVYTQILANGDQPAAPLTVDNSLNQKGIKSTINTYIAASYVKFIEMGGAQVVPIFSYSDQAYFDQILPQINGVLFPGGNQTIDIANKWTQNADYIVKYALGSNTNGSPFVIWGTGLGMQLLSYLTSGYDSTAIQPVQGQLSVNNTLNISAESALLTNISSELIDELQNGSGILYFNHHYAVTKDYYDMSGDLQSFWKVAATTTTETEEVFVSMIEAEDHPFYGVQFRPEVNMFEWKMDADRSEGGVRIAQILSNKMVEKVRKNNNTLRNPYFLPADSIYLYDPTTNNPTFSLTYVFPELALVQEDTTTLEKQQNIGKTAQPMLRSM